MRKVEARCYYKWKENLEELLNIENKPFIKVKPSAYQDEKYYMYGGIIKDKLRFFFYPSKMPNPRIDFILIDPLDYYNDKAVIYNNKTEKPFLSRELLNITYERKFTIGNPYKIISKNDGMIYYGFYTHDEYCQGDVTHFFDCYCSFVNHDNRIHSKGFLTHLYDFYELDDVPAEEDLNEEN